MTTASKECCRCRAVKDISEFSRDKYSSDGFTSQCKVCRNAIHKKWYDANPGTVRKIIEDGKEYRKLYYSDPAIKNRNRINFLQRTYGISEDEYVKLLEKQDSRCAICGLVERAKRNKHLAVDHCHTTGEIRGLLCSFCNQALGLFKNNVSFLKKAVAYLEKTNEY